MSYTPGPYGRLAQSLLHHKKSVIAFTVLITLVSIFLGLPPKIDSNIVALLPEEDPAANALQHLFDEGGGAAFVNLTWESDDPEALDAFLDELTPEFQQLDSVRYAMHEIDPELATRVGLLQLEASELSELNLRLKAALAMGPAMNPMIAGRLMEMGPLTERISQASSTDLFGAEPGQARQMIRPDGSNFDPEFCERVISDIERVIASKDLDALGVRLVHRGGGYHNVAEDLRGIRRDLVWTSAVSGMLVLLVLVVAFRSFRTTLLVFPPLIVANLINLALIWLFVGSLNTYTSFATAILIGLGIDFAIHLVGRFREESMNDVDFEEAIARAWDHAGPPCTTAALTSAGGFLALSIGKFRGFSQLGVILAVGLVLCLLAMLTLLPLLLAAFDRQPARPVGASLVEDDSKSSYRLAPSGLMVAVLMTGVLGVNLLPQLQFEYDISMLRPKGQGYSELDDAGKAFMRESYTPVVVSYDSREALSADHLRLQGLVDSGELPHVAKVLSIDSVLPPDQADRIEQLARLSKQVAHRNMRYLPPPIVKPLIGLKGWEAAPITVDDLPVGLPELLGVNGGKYRILLMPQGNMFDMRESAKLMDEVGAVVEAPAGEFLAQGSMFRTVMRDIPYIGALAFFFVSVLIVIDLKNTTHVVGALVTLLAGMTWAGVALQTFGVRLSMVNIVGIPILLGIGVDVVIHLLHRLREEGPGGVRRAFRTTGMAAVISTITTIASFSSLSFATNRGVQSLGLLVVIGLTAVFMASVIILPLIWSAGWRVTGRAPDGDSY